MQQRPRSNPFAIIDAAAADVAPVLAVMDDLNRMSAELRGEAEAEAPADPAGQEPELQLMGADPILGAFLSYARMRMLLAPRMPAQFQQPPASDDPDENKKEISPAKFKRKLLEMLENEVDGDTGLFNGNLNDLPLERRLILIQYLRKKYDPEEKEFKPDPDFDQAIARLDEGFQIFGPLPSLVRKIFNSQPLAELSLEQVKSVNECLLLLLRRKEAVLKKQRELGQQLEPLLMKLDELDSSDQEKLAAYLYRKFSWETEAFSQDAELELCLALLGGKALLGSVDEVLHDLGVERREQDCARQALRQIFKEWSAAIEAKKKGPRKADEETAQPPQAEQTPALSGPRVVASEQDAAQPPERLQLPRWEERERAPEHRLLLSESSQARAVQMFFQARSQSRLALGVFMPLLQPQSPRPPAPDRFAALDAGLAELEGVRAKKGAFLTRLRTFLQRPELRRTDLLDLFHILRNRQSERFQFIHESHSSRFRGIRLFFKRNRNFAEAHFWHTKAYQEAIKQIKDAYARAINNVDDPVRVRQQDDLLDYYRGNGTFHSRQTEAREQYDLSHGYRR